MCGFGNNIYMMNIFLYNTFVADIYLPLQTYTFILTLGELVK